MEKLTKHQEYQLYFDSAIRIFKKEFGVTLKKKQKGREFFKKLYEEN